MKIIKRDGTVQDWDANKIRAAVQKAEKAHGNSLSNLADMVAEEVTDICLNREYSYGVSIERVQDLVELALMRRNPDIAKKYIIYRQERAKIRNGILTPDPTTLSKYIHASKYAKILNDRLETYEETVQRVENMHLKKFPEFKTEIEVVFQLVKEMKVLPSLRSMQFGGAAIEDHNAKMYNCSFTLINRSQAFSEILYLLLCGCGVGYSVQFLHVDKLPKITAPRVDSIVHHIVEDDIIGWASALEKLINSYMIPQQGKYVEFSYHKIRQRGSKLKTSGGKAPGHLPFKEMLEDIRIMLNTAIGRKLRPIECHDIICTIAKAVLSGGVRRSSLIALFSHDDGEMMYCKAPHNFSYEGKNSQRALANNSAVLHRKATSFDRFYRIMELNLNSYGEPGFFFTDNHDYGCNPCGEIGLYPKTLSGETGFAFCNLTEVNCAKCKTKEDFMQAATAAAFIGLLQSTYTSFNYLSEASSTIAKEQRLLGVSLTGIFDNPEIFNWLDEAVKCINHDVLTWCKKLDISIPKRIATIKPSGTASLLLGGVANGIHPHYARRYFRRVTASPLEEVAQQYAKANPEAIEVKPNGDWAILFPVKAPDGAITEDDLTSFQFLDAIFEIHRRWIVPLSITNDLTHNVSCTVQFNPEDFEKLLEKIWINKESITAMTLFPRTADQYIPHIPKERLTEHSLELWNKLIANHKNVDYYHASSTNFEPECTGDKECLI